MLHLKTWKIVPFVRLQTSPPIQSLEHDMVFKKSIKMSLVVTALLIGSPAALAEELDSQLVQRGKGIAEFNCAICHAVGLTGESPRSDAPAFRTLSAKRNITLIGWELMDTDWGEHRKMPKFKINPDQVQAVLEWIRWVQPVEHGKRLVVENCSRCHAVKKNDKSAHPKAIPFRDISKFYPVAALEEAFAEGIETGHPDMPVFSVSITQLRDMVAYLETIQ